MSIVSRADENAAFQALEQQGIETLERVHDVHVDVNHWLEQSIVDASLAKCLPWLCDYLSMLTLLQMAASSRSRGAWRVQEFQLVPPTLCASNTKRTATRTRRQTASRKFIKRPEVRTVDGDVIDGFRTREYEDLC
ncbi:hypothetical protein PsorP6_014508 [Peronosclerospora sorghi]|uniref:Uncharacterized protein n=1 Tax=Peronosclerospora sorghi TaxID=230839 RepID=A0ACC0VUR6_9STRA|nr:hypothetical protein PsorP6_014508 [Peronosclerospora sorghi]